MANLPVVDASGGTVYVKATGTGTNVDPYIPQHSGTVAITGGIAGTVAVAGGIAGTVTIGAALPAGNNNIGDVDIASLPGIAGTVEVSNFPGTQPVSAASLPLPSGAATSANQSTTNTKLDTLISATDGVEASLSSIDTKLPASPATDRTTAAAPFATRLSDGSSFYKATTPSDTQPISGTVGVSGTVPVSIPGTVNTLERGGTIVAQLQPVTSGGLSIYRDISAGTAGANAKTSAGQLYGYYLANTGTVTAYFKLYNKASAPGTADTPVLTLPLFGTAAANVAFPNGIEFSAGIGVRVTTGIADTDATTPAGSACIVNLTYK
jgi:hypothetical protein